MLLAVINISATYHGRDHHAGRLHGRDRDGHRARLRGPPLTPTPEHPVTGLPATAPKTPAAVHVEGLAPGGRASVAASLHRAARIVEGHGHADGVAYPWHRRPPATLSKLRADLAEGYAVATANASVAAVRGALRAAWLAGELDRDGYERRAAALRTVSGGSAPGRAITPKEARKLFAGCAADPNRAAGARDAALLAVLYGLGLRRSEAVGLELADMDRAAGTLLVHGKGRRQRLAYLGLNGSADAMAAWLAVRGDAPGPLFNPVNRGGRVAEGRSMTGQAVAARVIRRSEAAGLGKLAPHSLRRSFATQLLSAGNDLAITADLMGHARTDTTRLYDRRGEDAKRAAMDTLPVPYVAPATAPRA